MLLKEEAAAVGTDITHYPPPLLCPQDGDTAGSVGAPAADPCSGAPLSERPCPPGTVLRLCPGSVAVTQCPRVLLLHRSSGNGELGTMSVSLDDGGPLR